VAIGATGVTTSVIAENDAVCPRLQSVTDLSIWRSGLPLEARVKIMNEIRLVFAVLLLLVLTSCAGNGGRLAEEDRPPVPEASAAPEYRLGAGDVVRVSVWKNPDLSVRVPVRPDGYISVPLVGDVLAGGRTPGEVGKDTETKLARFIRSPQVSIIVEELNSAEFQNRVRVVGGVEEPKSISHRDGMTVLDLVLDAGGINEFSSPQGAKLYRTIDGITRTFPVYLNSILTEGILDTNYRLLPGDVISIPERRF
jgi:polysaccharide export outer membrane protein